MYGLRRYHDRDCLTDECDAGTAGAEGRPIRHAPCSGDTGRARRQRGAAIASSGGANPAWRLLRGEMSAAAWQAARAQWLMPHLKVLQGLLGGPAAAPAAEAQNL